MVEAVPRPVLYLPSGWTREQVAPAELAIEDFEVIRLVDGHGDSVADAAVKLGVSKSTAGRMLERGRRNLVLAMERRSPIYIDATVATALSISKPSVGSTASEPFPVAIAVQTQEEESEVAPIFGRAPAFALAGGKARLRFVENPGEGVKDGAAALAVELLQSCGVEHVAAGRFGSDALELLGNAQIQPYTLSGMAIREAVQMLHAVNK